MDAAPVLDPIGAQPLPASGGRSGEIWTGENDRDAHLRSADFLDVENHRKITFAGRFTARTGATAFKGEVELTIRGVTKTVPLDIVSLGEWKTPFWVGDENKGELTRIGFEALATLNRHDFGVSWQDELSATRSSSTSMPRRSCSKTSSEPARSSTTEIDRRDRVVPSLTARRGFALVRRRLEPTG